MLREVLLGHDTMAHFAAESPVDRSVAAGRAFVRAAAMAVG
jgi:dTDP-glucose 4,6-dehydratase